MKLKCIRLICIGIFSLYSLICVYIFFYVDFLGPEISKEISFGKLYKEACTCERWMDISPLASPPRHSISSHNSFTKDICDISERPVNNVDLQVYELYQTIPIRYPQYIWTHTGWYERYDITYSSSQWEDEPLEVFVVLHSHNDPGWLKTFETYYTGTTSSILSKTLSELKKDEDLKFCWTEIVYLRRWFKSLSMSDQAFFKKLVQSGRFEILSGGWVMTDEAVAHYQAMLDQLTDGHLWLLSELNYTIDHAMVIDTFGHSPTMAYLFQKSGIKNLILQRTHFAIKKHLALNKQLEFQWRQAWDDSGSTELFSHLTPFLLYNIVYNCGPDISVCCQFDFTKNKCWSGGEYVKADEINEDNVHQKAEMLLDQYRKKAQLFKHNKLLVLHGDDFRYSTRNEWSSQVSNLKKLFSVMNNSPHMKVKVKFSTPGEYMEAAQAEFSKRKLSRSSGGREINGAPTLAGDFFTYSDRGEQYWSGYYSSRPYLKSIIRKLQRTVRSTEVLLSQCVGHNVDFSVLEGQLQALKNARHALHLLQHHDAVTGTSKKVVTEDFIIRAESALKITYRLVAELTDCLTETPSQQTSKLHYKLVGGYHGSAETAVINDKEIDIAVVNMLTTSRSEVMRIKVKHSLVEVRLHTNEAISCQISPVLNPAAFNIEDAYELSFIARVAGLGISHYRVIQGSKSPASCHLASVHVYSAIHRHDLEHRVPFPLHWEGLSDFSIENQHLKASFCSCSGLLQGITTKDERIPHKVELQFLTYGTSVWTNPFRDKSGAYIFLPDGPAKEMLYDTVTSVMVRGPVLSSATAYLPMITHTAILFNSTDVQGTSLHIENRVDLSANNTEIVMRLNTNVNNYQHTFFSDLNGFQVHKRRYQSRLYLQGNFYPMTSLAYLEDDRTRFSLISAESHGVASLDTGQLEVVLDRRLSQDDWRGLNEGVMDNKPTVSHFSLLIEQSTSRKRNAVSTVGFPSLLGHMAVHSLNSPFLCLQKPIEHTLPYDHHPLDTPLPCDVHLMNMRLIDLSPKQADVLIHLHRLGVDCGYSSSVTAECVVGQFKMSLDSFFRGAKVHQIAQTSLTGVSVRSVVKLTDGSRQWSAELSSMHIETYKLTLLLNK